MDKNSVLAQIFKDKYAATAFVVLLILYLMILFADFLAPYSKEFSDRHRAYVPPSQIFTIDENGRLSRPYTYNYKRYFNPDELKITYKLDRSKKYYLKFFAKGERYKFLGLIPMERHLVTVDKDGRLFLLGTDINGRDIFSRILFGGRISLTIGFLALFISFPLGMLYGGISGYLGGPQGYEANREIANSLGLEAASKQTLRVYMCPNEQNHGNRYVYPSYAFCTNDSVPYTQAIYKNNVLYDPVTSSPVVLISKQVFEKIVGEDYLFYMLKKQKVKKMEY